MKIRTDFVTNSSSSSYVATKMLIIPTQKGNLMFYHNNKGEEESPEIFDKFINYHYLTKGSKPTVKRMISSSSLQRAFIDYIHDKYNMVADVNELYFETTEATIGYGHSLWDDFENESSYLTEHLHPVLRDYMKNNDVHWLSTASKFGGIYIQKETVIDGAELSCQYTFLETSIQGKDLTEEVFLSIYHSAGAPLLSVEAWNEEFVRNGLSEEQIKQITDNQLQILYLSGKTKKNDIIVYFDTNNEINIEYTNFYGG